jgi:hypothetical protein
MQEASHTTGLLVVCEGDLLEASDPHHQGLELNLFFGGKRMVDLRGGEIEGGHG